MRGLEERLRRGEKEALMAEERARLHQSLISHKMAEMAKLQDTLTDQNQVTARWVEGWVGERMGGWVDW